MLMRKNESLPTFKSQKASHRQALLLLFGCLVICLVSFLIRIPERNLLPPVERTPSYETFRPLLARWVAVGPVYVTGNDNVPYIALVLAGVTLAEMLQHRPE